MGLTSKSTGINSVDNDFVIKKNDQNTKIIALAGNPNVGKSTIFNSLTGLKQHTGNWPGKTVSNAQGIVNYKDKKFIFVDIPGTYSLFAHSREEEIAGDFICFSNPDAVVIVCDATCLERNLNLALQTLEVCDNVILCINLMDEAEKKGISIDLERISKKLNIPVIGTKARQGKGLTKLLSELDTMLFSPSYEKKNTYKIRYNQETESAVEAVSKAIEEEFSDFKLNKRWTALKLLEDNLDIIKKLDATCGFSLLENERVHKALIDTKNELLKSGIDKEKLLELSARSSVLCAEEICCDTVEYTNSNYNLRDRKIDRILTSRLTGIPIMLLMLGFIFWLTICAANVPSGILSSLFTSLENKLVSLALYLNIPETAYSILIFGVYRVVSWVVAVMLPPMAIFFPLFTLLEDSGYLPRVAFNLDCIFKKCKACGKQALTMCMGFGCNAAGVTGCRIIDSPRERLIAVLTNNFVPCNGRFPMLISIITIFFTYSVAKPFGPLIGTAILMLVVLLGIGITFLISFLLSKTILKGTPASFTLELPPYRTPQIGKTIIHSIFDRTLFVLGRAVCAAAPAGLIIWLFANLYIGDTSLLNYCAEFLEPFAKLLGLDGKILIAFILGIPANEIVIPIIIMAYTSGDSLVEAENLFELKTLFEVNGWTWITAISVMLFSLMHWPCSTTLMTVKKETKSIKWTLLAFLIPTVCGILICFLFNTVVNVIP